ncbi:hypothetical protein ACQEU5_24840 [Marinactinospora thermotolerans]|uniref:hypothetical protein n=1 Tax=Marinactinospora thermotolerans TaxID=531310 RepID=UPI003D9293F4
MSKQINRQRPGDRRRLAASNESLRVGDSPAAPEVVPSQEAAAAEPAAVEERELAPADPAAQTGAVEDTDQAAPQAEESAPSVPEVVPSREAAAAESAAVEEREPAPADPAASEPLSFLGAAEDLRKAWESSVLSARNEPKKWAPYSVSLPQDLWERLEARVEADQQRYGLPSLAMSHYINTALSGLPKNPRTVGAIATEYVQHYGLVPPAMRSSGTRAHHDVIERMRKLRTQLRRVARPGLLGHLQAAAVSALLDTLDEESTRG